MTRIMFAMLEIGAAAIVLFPVFWILNKTIFHSARKRTIYCIFSFYLVAVYSLVGLPDVTYLRPELVLNLIPVLGLIDDWKNSILNVLLFVPLGLMLPLLWSGFRRARETLLFGFGMSLAIELLQILVGRATDVNDLITNILGTYLGFCAAGVLLWKFPVCGKLNSDGKVSELYIVCAVVIITMFFVQPFISAILYELVLF